VIRYEKNNPFLLKLMAKAYQNAGEPGFSVQAIEQAIELEPDDWETHIMHGMLQEQKKKLGSARRSFRLAYRLNPTNPAVIIQFDRGSLVLEKVVLRLKAGLRHVKPDAAAKSFHLSGGPIVKEMLMTWRLDTKLRHFFADCLPDPHARSFRLEDGLITRDLVVRLVEATGEKLKPKPNRFTFRFTWT
jgi:tetratricopeptide (TPR) repeat protein